MFKNMKNNNNRDFEKRLIKIWLLLKEETIFQEL